MDQSQRQQFIAEISETRAALGEKVMELRNAQNQLANAQNAMQQAAAQISALAPLLREHKDNPAAVQLLTMVGIPLEEEAKQHVPSAPDAPKEEARPTRASGAKKPRAAK